MELTERSDPGDGTESATAEEFDPRGTLTLILVYLGLLVVMWVYIYFVEFLGNELVVVG